MEMEDKVRQAAVIGAGAGAEFTQKDDEPIELD